jgi:hypothetical protein
VTVCSGGSSADEDRVYSQGCYVELEVPLASHCRCEVVHHLCFIFPHDGEHNYEVLCCCAVAAARLIAHDQLLRPALVPRAQRLVTCPTPRARLQAALDPPPSASLCAACPLCQCLY